MTTLSSAFYLILWHDISIKILVVLLILWTTLDKPQHFAKCIRRWRCNCMLCSLDVDFLYAMFSHRSGYQVLIVLIWKSDFLLSPLLISELQQRKVLLYLLELESIWMNLKSLMLNHLWAVFWVRFTSPPVLYLMTLFATAFQSEFVLYLQLLFSLKF